ncbi:MAG: DUF4105 domain-containing protein [Bacteroidaceae bacterium]|nr:DUF4105 domain-containing protein [Bacteroidaceae bacterium]
MKRLYTLLLTCAFGIAATSLSAQDVQSPAGADNTGAAEALEAGVVKSAEAVAAVDDSVFTVSLLTCSPGQEVYELYGHTAIRVQNPARGTDHVFNYGAFSFEQPHFIWRFVLGQCDYMVVPQEFRDFLMEYEWRGSSVTEQVLNLKPTEARALATSLYENILPENREYRYNIFRNNCTTKARDIIEANIRGTVVYPARPRRNTFRTILHEFTEGHPWAREGNDLLLGAAVDTAIVERDEMFAPIYMMHYADSAFIDAGRQSLRPLVSERRELLAENPERQRAAAARLPQVPFTPAALGWAVLALGLLIAAWEIVRRRVCWPVDAVLMTLQGLAGLLLTFMTLASEHPGVASNWQVWVLNPLPLLFLPWVIKADIKRQSHQYHRFAAVWLAAFVVLYFIIPQHFSQIIMPVALLLLSRAIVHILIYKKS